MASNPEGYPAKPTNMTGRKSGHQKPQKNCANPKRPNHGK